MSDQPSPGSDRERSSALLPPRSAMRRGVRGVVVIAIVVVLGFPAYLALNQDRLVFRPQPVPAVAPVAGPRSDGRVVETVRVPVGDGLTMTGWLARPSGRSPLILYFGGNAEEVSWMIEASSGFRAWALLAVNYRGYGGNAGAPSEAALFTDALAIHDWAVARADIDRTRVVVFGRSLGSGVAVHLAASRPVAGVVLATPFDSLRAVAQSLYPLVPVSLLLRHPFDSLARAPSLGMPMLTLGATHDQTVPIAHARRLFDAWGGPKTWREIAAGHGSIRQSAQYWESIGAFLAERLAPAGT